MRLGVDPKHADQMVRGTVVLPHGLGRSKRVLAIAGGEKQKEATDAGADFVGGDDLAKKVEEGWTGLANGVETGRARETLAYRNFKGEDLGYRVGEVLVHVVNHSTYHRGQVATLLRQLGATPVSTEYLMMLDEGA